MRITRIAISNYARLRDLDIRVRGHLVIVGANDVGKTSLLRVLQGTLGSSVGHLYQTFSPADLRDPGQPLIVEVTWEEFGADERALYYREITVAPDGSGKSLVIRLEIAPDEDPEAVAIRRFFPDRGDDRSPTREQLLAFGWRYLPATRGAGTQLDGPASALRTLLDTIDLGAEKQGLVAMLEEYNDKLGTSATLTDLRERIAAHLSRAMPRTIDPAGLAVRSGADPASSVLGNVSMFFDRDGAFTALTDQSDGMRQLMAMTLFDLAQGAANVIAIDEPELYLNPASQRTAAELLTHTGNQKLLVTHSPFIMQRFEPRQVVAIGPDGAARQLPADKLTAIGKLRARWWSSRLLEALSARAVILVEGIADRILIEEADRALGIGLDRLGAVVFEIDGADKFEHVFKFLGPQGFDVRLFGLVDEDHRTKWVGQFGGRPQQVLGTKVWVCDPDLEGEYCTALGGPQVARLLIEAGVCRDQALLQCAGVGELDALTPLDVAAFCRKNKVEAAVAVGAALDAQAAGRITPVADLLTALRAGSAP
ncbi:MAG TPA: AAA family ATPase [Actinocrinis sp.]|nr:AAA family ATPase [Actinocrinis sp.]